MGAGRLAVVQAYASALAGSRSGRVCGWSSAKPGPGAVCLPGLFDGGGSLYVHRAARASVRPGMGTGAVTPALARSRLRGGAGSVGDKQCMADELLARFHVIIRTRADCPSEEICGLQYLGHGPGSPKQAHRGDALLYRGSALVAVQ